MTPDHADARLLAFRRLSIATLAAALVLVAIGGAVRATDSGLACPDWPRCYGLWVPPADLNMWLEHSHRLAAGVVGLMVAALLVWALLRLRHRRDLVWTAAAAAVLVVAQAALGAVVVLRLLRAELVTAHLGMAMAVVACLAILVVATGRPAAASRPRPRPGGTRLARASLAVAGLCYAQLLVGAHVTGTGAGLVFRDFPLMGGAVVPAVTSQRELFHATHRLLALALALGVVALAVLASRERASRQATGGWEPSGRWLARLPWLAAVLVAAQVALGVANLATETSWVTVIPHLAVASWIWTVLVFHVLLAYGHGAPSSPEEAGASAREEVPA